MSDTLKTESSNKPNMDKLRAAMKKNAGMRGFAIASPSEKIKEPKGAKPTKTFGFGSKKPKASNTESKNYVGKTMSVDRRDPARRALFENLKKSIDKDFGVGALQRIGDVSFPKVDACPTGSISLDYALGVGGYPRGRVIEVYGPEASGKTTLCLHALLEFQNHVLDREVAFMDVEHAMDMDYARKLGLDVKNLYFSQPSYGEQALELVDRLVESGLFSAIVVDSVAALVPKKELEGEVGDAHVGLQARMMSQALRKLVGKASRTNTTVFFINQTRQKIGVTFGSGTTTTGGNALKFYCSVRVSVVRIGAVKSGEKDIGNRVKAKIVKNKVAPPHRECEFDIIFGEGINTFGDLVDLGVDTGLIQKSGAWYVLEDGSRYHGKPRLSQVLKENDELRTTIEKQIKDIVFAADEVAEDMDESDSEDLDESDSESMEESDSEDTEDDEAGSDDESGDDIVMSELEGAEEVED